MPDSDEEAEGERRLNGAVNGNGDIDPKLRREEQELAKIESGIAQVPHALTDIPRNDAHPNL